MRLRNGFFTLGLFISSMAACSSASVLYTYEAEQPACSVATNGTAKINLYLVETLSSGSNSIINNNKGLFTIGISVQRDPVSGNGDAGLTNFAYDLSDFGNKFDSTQQDLTASGVQFDEAIVSSNGPGIMLGNAGGGTAPSYADAIYIGSVTVAAGATPNTTTTFDVGAEFIGGSYGGNTLTKTTLDLDLSSASPAYTGASSDPTYFTVTTTPEPLASWLATLSTVLILCRRRRKTLATPT